MESKYFDIYFCSLSSIPSQAMMGVKDPCFISVKFNIASGLRVEFFGLCWSELCILRMGGLEICTDGIGEYRCNSRKLSKKHLYPVQCTVYNSATLLTDLYVTFAVHEYPIASNG